MSSDPLWNRSLLVFVASLLLLPGCPSAPATDDDDVSDDDDDSAATDDDDTVTDDDDTAPTFPDSPLPFTITLSGGLNESITIDTFGSCQNYTGSSAFRQQWSGSGWVVRVAVAAGSYTGAGTYDDTTGATVTLSRNVANGEFFQAGTAQGHTVSVVMEGDDATVAWGSATVSGMTDTAAGGGTVTLDPATLPVWCSSIQH